MDKYERRARRGSAWLERKGDKDWHQKVDPRILNLHSGNYCIVGQVQGHFSIYKQCRLGWVPGVAAIALLCYTKSDLWWLTWLLPGAMASKTAIGVFLATRRGFYEYSGLARRQYHAWIALMAERTIRDLLDDQFRAELRIAYKERLKAKSLGPAEKLARGA